jgi:hypothetical protein
VAAVVEAFVLPDGVEAPVVRVDGDIGEQYEPEPQPAPSAPAVPGGDVDCSDFSFSLEAQDYLLPGDPHRLDADGDGQACDSLP